MADLKGTKTHDNLLHAFAGESQANRRYLYFADKADIEGYPEVAGNFRDTAEGETYEYTQMYPSFAKTAREEGFTEIADWFETLARAEKSHANRFSKMLASIQA